MVEVNRQATGCWFSRYSQLESNPVSTNLMRSLVLTALLAFIVPSLAIGSVLAFLVGLSYVPGIATLAQAGSDGIVNFLSIFGNGCPLEGAFVICGTCSTVGGVFDVFNYYFYQSVREH